MPIEEKLPAESDPHSSAEAGPRKKPATLKKGAIGLAGVVFMVVAFSAPTTGMTGNLPVVVGFGNGTGAAADYIIATIILAIFSVGFVALARHITSAGAFYTLVSRGWSRIPGLAAGVLPMVTYMTMEAGLIGIFSAFARSTIEDQFGIHVPWPIYALIAVIAIAVVAHFDISIGAKILAIVLTCELLILAGTAFSVLFQGGGPDGIIWSSINPLSAFSANGLKDGVIGLGLLFAFWTWVGFESTAIYGEESKDPKKIVPRATMIAVIGLGVFYTFIAWMTVSANGATQSIKLARTDPFELLYSPTRIFVGQWGVVVFEWLVVFGSFACALAIHNSASRYLFAFGRDGLLWHRLGEAHSRHGSPWIASLIQSVFAACILLVCLISHGDPYSQLFVLVAIMATILLLIVETMISISTIVYFHVKKQHPETASWWRTITAPVIGALGMMYVIYLMLTNMKAAAGDAASGTLFFSMIPWIIVILPVGSMLVALYLRAKKPRQYAKIGSTVFEDDLEESRAAVE